MNFITSFLKTFNPQIIIKHFQTSEKIENKIINHEIVCFDTENLTIKSILAAKVLAKRMGQKVFPLLNNLAKNTKDKKQLETINKTKAWVHKKAVWHPALVEKCTHKVLKNMQSAGSLNNIPLSYKEIYTDTSIAAILHDIGRLSEVDIIQGGLIKKDFGMNKSHATIGFDILKSSKIKPEILLAVRYHEFADIKEAQADKIYLNLSQERKIIAEFYIKLLQDMDKAGNLVERSKFGLKKSAEYFNPAFVKDYDLTEEYYKIAMSGIYLPVKDKSHFLDAMLHYVTMGYDAHYKETKQFLACVVSDYFLRIYEEIWDEYNNSKEKNPMRLANTLEKIIKLEDYAIFERTGLKINKKNRQEILMQIAELKKAR